MRYQEPCKVLNYRMGKMMHKELNISKGQAGCRPNRGCVDHVYTIGTIIHGKKDAGLTSYWTNNILFLSRCTKGLRHSGKEKRIEEKVVGNWDQRT